MIHFVNNHFWPDGSPSGVLVEELADTLRDMGHDTVLVAGTGSFHETTRPAPSSPIVRLATGEGARGQSQISILRDYVRFWKAVKSYVVKEVKDGDAVFMTSSPFVNVFMTRLLRRKQVATIFHLQDYLPSNVSSLGMVQRLSAPALKWIIDHYLRQWNLVMMCSGNIEYQGSNGVVARLWPTIVKPADRVVDKQAKSALYAGNLGIVHNTAALVQEIEKLHGEGWTIDCYGDGPGLASLPDYVEQHPFASGNAYLDVLYSHPLHLVCSIFGNGSFPSKVMNTLYIGADVQPCGFVEPMLKELDFLRSVPDLSRNRQESAKIVDELLKNGGTGKEHMSSREMAS